MPTSAGPSWSGTWWRRPEFSIEPRKWCFPIVGCVAYRGYFSEAAGEGFAAKLRARGFDVTVGGVPAYSTLGRTADPVLNTMLGYGDTELAAIIFHELRTRWSTWRAIRRSTRHSP